MSWSLIATPIVRGPGKPAPSSCASRWTRTTVDAATPAGIWKATCGRSAPTTPGPPTAGSCIASSSYAGTARSAPRRSFEPREQTAARPEREPHLRLDAAIGERPHAVALQDHSQEELGLHQREFVADAEPRAPAEGEVGKPGMLGHALGAEALRVEALGILPEVRMAMGHVRDDVHHRSGTDAKAADLV